MIRIPCPYCGRRNSDEFHYAGEVRPRPDPSATDEVAWRDYLYMKQNPAGWTTERWYHQAGCGKFLLTERHTVTNEIRSARPEAAPATGGTPGGKAGL